MCTKLRRRRTKSKEKSETSRDRGSRFLKMLIHEMQFLKDRPPTAKAERKRIGNRRLRKMNGVGWLQKSAVCGKIDSYGASQGRFRCKSGRECHAGERFRVLVLQRMSMDSHAMRSFISLGGDFVRHAFTSHGGDFTHCARFCIVTDDFARYASLHRPAMISHSVRVLFISPADDFARRACSYTKGREKDDFKGSDF